MSGNTFGEFFKVTTFGESHGKALGCIIDGCPPQIVDTKLASHILSTDERKEASAQRHPLKSIGSAKLVAQTAFHLLSAKDNWITGQVIAVDGGLSSLKT